MYLSFIKPLFDFVVALFILMPLFVFLVAICMLILIIFKQNPFFIQTRITKNDKPFKIYKFRTMLDHTDQAGNLLPDEQRTPKLGLFLRKTSIDELPQLFNVLKGDMSLVGPRPLLPQYLPRYTDFQRQRHAVKAGITGLAQVNGRNLTSWNDRFELDVFYAKNCNLCLDLKILFQTFNVIFAAKGINAESGETMPPFEG